MKAVLAALMLLMSMPTLADVAKVVILRPPVFSDGQELVQGSAVCVGERITTTDRSFAVLQFTDGSKITIRPRTEVVIKEFSYLEEFNKAEIDLVYGGLRIVTGALAKASSESYTVRTPVALMGVRGTEFSIEYVEE